jgi:hypothetical protein
LPIYRVYGELIKTYYTDVSAEDKIDAFDIACSRPASDWFDVETDEGIEPIEVTEYDPELGVPKDGQLL